MALTPDMLVSVLLWYVVFVISTSAHEAAHAAVALIGGDPTAARGGQVTLNPAPHIRREPMGMVVVPLLSFFLGGGWMFGWASAPYDPYWAMRHPRRAALMSLAGPAANFLIAGLALVLLWIGLGLDWFEQPSRVSALDTLVEGQGSFRALGRLLSIALMLNVILGVFNLLPVPPLDGHAAVPLFLPDRLADQWRDWMRTIGFMGIVLAWLVMGRLFRPLFTLVLGILYPGTSWS